MPRRVFRALFPVTFVTDTQCEAPSTVRVGLCAGVAKTGCFLQRFQAARDELVVVLEVTEKLSKTQNLREENTKLLYFLKEDGEIIGRGVVK